MLAAGWGFAEATLWFIVPDVLLSWLAMDRPIRAYRAVIPTVVGALLGGTLMWEWGRLGSESAYVALDAIPAIGRELIESVRVALDAGGLSPMLLGAFIGTPYKIYAVAWGELGGGLLPFLLLSLPARAIRFVLAALIASGFRLGPLAGMTLRRRRVIHAAVWFCFYLGYFVVMR
jgi:membrane protein YqaA with SNARE-associated domain